MKATTIAIGTISGMRSGMPRSAVPFLDVGATYAELRPELDRAYRRVMESGTYILGEEVEAFEREFANYCGAEHCVAVASGLDALTLGLRALGVRAGDEVIVPGHTYIATWLAVSATGARPIAVDVDDTGNIDPSLLAPACGPAVRAVIPVHLYGQPADVRAIGSVAEAHGIAVLEDAAQAHGAALAGARVGSTGRVAAFSFYPAKNLGAFGDAGAIVTSDPDLAAAARLQRNYGSSSKYSHDVRGVNSRLDPLQAAFLRVKLAHLDVWNHRRRSIAHRYLAEIRERSGIVELPRLLEGSDPAWHLFVIRSSHRDALREHLRTLGIETLIHYPAPPHRSGAYVDAQPWPPLPVTDRLAATVLSLPIGPHLDDRSVTAVIEAVNGYEIRGGRNPSTATAGVRVPSCATV